MSAKAVVPVMRTDPSSIARSSLVPPHGGTLVECLATGAEAEEMAARSGSLPSVALDTGELLDLELIASGGASPVRGFLGQADHRSVLEHRSIASGALFPLPLTVAVPVERLGAMRPGTEVALRSSLGQFRGVLTVRDAFVRDLREEARLVFGTDDPTHAAVRALLSRPSGALGGEVRVLRPPGRRFETAREVRRRLAAAGHLRVAAGLGAGLVEAARAAMPHHVDALLAPVLLGGVDIDAPLPIVGASVPFPRRRAGAREALFQAIVLRNFGVSHLVLGAAHTGLKIADALLRNQDELGLAFLHAGARPSPSGWAGGRATCSPGTRR
jgi:sulfate adenylyltransferase